MERPEIIINVASSLDGVIASNKGALVLSSTDDWIRVHELRNSVDALLVGVNTIIKDDPLLTVRYVQPKKPGPFRVILDTNCRIPKKSNVLKNQDTNPTIVFTSDESTQEKTKKIKDLGIMVVPISKKDEDGFLDLNEVLDVLKTSFKVKKLLVEGGSTIITSFVKRGLVDLMHIFYAPVFAGGKKAKLLYEEKVVEDVADTTNFDVVKVEKLGEGFFISLKIKKMK
ncbi:MAG: RibD family protein [Candidatus Heimdallarchaeaceae archaeon]|jgi:riboflavin-specific deaminase-like protein